MGGKLLGWRTVCAVELNPYCRRVLLARQRDGILPRFPIWDDVRTFDGRPWRGKIGIVTGGFPCQRFSSATRGRATAEDLWPEMLRVVGEAEPTHVLAENVSRAAIEIAAEDLEALGYSCKAIPLSAKDLGADHVRPRYWLRAHSNLHGKLRGTINAEMAECSSVPPRVWETKPGSPRVVNGMAGRMDQRLRASGNGQVPAVVCLAWQTLAP